MLKLKACRRIGQGCGVGRAGIRERMAACFPKSNLRRGGIMKGVLVGGALTSHDGTMKVSLFVPFLRRMAVL
jgi:hypothetical protein